MALVAAGGAARPLAHKAGAALGRNETAARTLADRVHLAVHGQGSASQRAAAVATADAARSAGMAKQAAALGRTSAQFAKVARLAKERARAMRKTAGVVSCGIPSYSNAKPAGGPIPSRGPNAVTFAVGDVVSFRCERGFSTDGAKGGPATFDVECAEQGYWKQPSAICMEYSPCGELPAIMHARPTGKVEHRRFFEFACQEGYSLDGKQVVAGGFRQNARFRLECLEFQAAYSKFDGKCQPYSFVPKGEIIRMYNEVSKIFFFISCKGTLKTEFAKGKVPSGLDKVCGNFEESAGECDGLVADIKADFDKQLAARKEFRDAKEEWHGSEKDIPGINDESGEFCQKVWKLLEYPSLLQHQPPH